MKLWSRSARARHAQPETKLSHARLADFEFFRIRTAHDGTVRVRAGLLIDDAGAASGPVRDAVLCRLAGLPHLGFIAATGDEPVEIGAEADSLRAPVLSYRLRRQGGADSVVIGHPLDDVYATAIPEQYGPSLPLQVNRRDIRDWEVFRLVACNGAGLPQATMAALDSVRPALAAQLSIETVLRWLLDASVDLLRRIGPALLRLTPPDTLASVGAALVDRPDLAHKLAAAWPEDPWIATAIPLLAEWSRDRTLRRRVEVGSDLDELASTVTFGERNRQLPLHLLAAARRHVQPTRGIAIVATARNEGPFFLDWIAHHRALGVEHFFIYSSDDNDDESSALLERLAEHGVVTFLHNHISPTASRQRKAYNHAFLCVPELLDFRWTAIVDLDEYLLVDPAQFDSLGDFFELQESRGAGAVALNWLIYGPQGEAAYRDRPVAERLQRRKPAPDRHVKTIVRTNQAWGALPHVPLWPDRAHPVVLDALGQPHYSPGLVGGIGAFRDATDPGPAWINHYFYRSLPEIVLKYGRSYVDGGGTHPLRFTAHFVPGLLAEMRGPLVDDRTILAWSDPVSAARNALDRLPGIAAAHRACVRALCLAANRLVREIPEHAADLPHEVRDAYLSLAAESIAAGVALP